MRSEKIYIHEIEGGNVDELNAGQDIVKWTKTGVFLCKEGEVQLTLDGEEFRLRSNDLIVYFSYSALHIIRRTDNLRGILIGADLETIQPMLYQVSNFNALFVIKQHPLCHLSAGRAASLWRHIALLADVAQRESDGRDADAAEPKRPIAEMASKQMELLSYSLMLDILQCYAHVGMERAAVSRKDEVLQHFVASLYRNYRTEHEVSFYADQQFLTNRYFSTIVKESSGKTPSEWIVSALLVDAQTLLTTSSMNVKEISDLLGFPNQSYFGKWFKIHVGVGPLGYRKGRGPRNLPDAEFADVVRRGVAYVQQMEGKK